MGGGQRITIDTSLLKNPEFRCEFEGCGKYFGKLSRLKYHQNTHLSEKPFKCDYAGCTSSYFRPYHLKRHVESIHKACSKSPRLYRCSVEGCEAAFETESSFYYHSKRKHFEQPLKCSFCELKFTKKWKLKEHEAGHTGANPFKCENSDCNEEFKDFTKFKAHKRQHEKKSQVKLAKCPVDGCDETFQKWSDLVNHKKTFHFVGTQCKICQKTFSQRNLKVHLPIHSEERKTFPCTFDDCPRFYFHLKNLTYHVKVKHNGDGFQCLLCNKKLSSKQKLKQHQEIMHTESPKRKRSPKKKKLPVKLGQMTKDEDWTSKKTGPSRLKGKKFSCINFPAVENPCSKPSSQRTSDESTSDTLGSLENELSVCYTLSRTQPEDDVTTATSSLQSSLPRKCSVLTNN